MKIIFLSILISIGVKKAEWHIQIYICYGLTLPGKSEREEETADWESEQKKAGSCGTDKYTVVLMEIIITISELWMWFWGVNVSSAFFHDPIENQDDQKSF